MNRNGSLRRKKLQEKIHNHRERKELDKGIINIETRERFKDRTSKKNKNNTARTVDSIIADQFLKHGIDLSERYEK